jgi:hypothetical protein
MLTEFELVPLSELEGAVVHSKSGQQRDLVIARVSPTAFGDLFGRPGVNETKRRRLTKEQCNLLARSNLEALSRVIIAKFDANEIGSHKGYPFVEILEADLRQSGEAFSDTVLMIHAQAGYKGA